MTLFLLIAIPAVGFGGWPVITRYFGTSAGWTNVILMSVTSMLVIAYYAKSLRGEPLSAPQAAATTGAAILNSIALVLFGILIQKYPQYVPAAQAMMPIVSFVGAWKLLGMPVTTGQTLCYGMAAFFIAAAGYFTPPQP